MLIRFEPSFTGLLSAIAYCLRRQLEPFDMLTYNDPPSLLQSVDIANEENIEQRFNCHMGKVMGVTAAEAVLQTSLHAWYSEYPGIAQAIRQYLQLALRLRSDPGAQLFNPSVAAVVKAARRTNSQAHQYLGLLRFRQISQHLFLADFEPDACVLPLVFPHFKQRFADQTFVIRDLKRDMAALHLRNGRCALFRLAESNAQLENSQLLTSNDSSYAADEFAALWQQYLEHLTIPERIKPGLQQSNMPKKYWKYLVEKPDALYRAPQKRDSQ